MSRDVTFKARRINPDDDHDRDVANGSGYDLDYHNSNAAIISNGSRNYGW